MKLALAGAVVCAMAFSSAVAQTTTCSPFGNSVQCETAPSDADTFVRGMSTLGNALRARKSRETAAAAALQAIKDGDCALAGQIVRAYGNADDVRYVAANCVSREARAAQEKARADQAQDAWRNRIARLTLLGRCDEAKAAALEGGSLDVAEQVMRVCVPQPITAGETPTHIPR